MAYPPPIPAPTCPLSLSRAEGRIIDLELLTCHLFSKHIQAIIVQKNIHVFATATKILTGLP